MLFDLPYTDDEISRATAVLREVQSKPAEWVINFERQFVNTNLRFALTLVVTICECNYLQQCQTVGSALQISRLHSQLSYSSTTIISLN
jgi:hypothetical protein